MKRIPNFALIALLVAISLASCDSLLSSKMENPISDRDSIQLALDSLTPELQLIWLAERIAVDSVTDTLEIIYPHWYVHQLAQNYELLNVDNYDSVLNIANWSARYVQFGDTIQQYPEFYKYAALNSAKRRAFRAMFSTRHDMDSAFADYGANNAISDSSIFDELKDWYWRGSYVQSLSFLDSLDKDETLVANPKYWQIRGYVYKDLYKYDRALTKAGRLRKQAIQSYLRAMEISADTEEEIHNNSIKALKYLSSTLYNDAARTLDEFDVDKALSLFEDYIYIAENVLKIDKGKLNDRRIDVNLFAASKVLQFMDYLPIHDTTLASQADSLYQEVISIDNRNTAANYNAYQLSIKDKDFRKKLLSESDLERQRLETETAEQKLQMLTMGGGLFVMLLLAGMSYRAYNQKKKANNLIAAQKVEVEKAHEQLEEKNKEITDSIIYAKRIQEAILPPLKLVKENLEESFILYKPKDIVAGDFYWMETVDDTVIFAAADCTGHGVPGAMVSVVCSNALNRAVREFGLTEPAKILDKTLEIVIERFEKSEEDVKDGMDIALCALNTKTNELQYAGANNPLWIISKEGELSETKATKQPVGKYMNPKPYMNHTIQLNEGDSVYIFSDGYPDQFGGPRGKKLKSNAFKEMLLTIQDQSMDEQKSTIDDYFENWRGEQEQIDDVCVIEVRI